MGCLFPLCRHSSVGQYQCFTSGIRYYKFKTVFGIPRYFDLTSVIEHIYVRYVTVLIHSILLLIGTQKITDNFAYIFIEVPMAVYSII